MNLKKVLSVLAVSVTVSASVGGSAWAAAAPTVDATAQATTAVHAVIGEKTGLVFNESSFKVVKKVLQRGDVIPRHHHPGATVLFTVVKGQMKVCINGKENYEVVPGKMLKFNGQNYIQAVAAADSIVFVTLIENK